MDKDTEPSESPTLVREPTAIIHPPMRSFPHKEMFGRLSGPHYSREDQYLKLALKIGLVILVLSLEAILIASVAYVMYRAVQL